MQHVTSKFRRFVFAECSTRHTHTSNSILLKGSSRRHYSTIKRGHDRQVETLYERLGFGKDNEAHRIRRSLKELEDGFALEVRKLTDVENNAADSARLESLKEAYVLLRDEGFRNRYNSHYYSSNDAQLHILCDGGQVSANYNPEHQTFDFVDHSQRIKNSSASSSQNVDGNTASTPLEGSTGSSETVSSYNNFQDVFRYATGLGPQSSAEARVHDAAEAHSPINGASVSFVLKISFEESICGCSKTLDVVKHVQCRPCKGNGVQQLRKRRACPQCLGRGSTHLPSATYHIEKRCQYCGGEGTMPPPRCSVCKGRGVRLNQHVAVPVRLPAGTTSHTVFRLPNHGHDGARGGRAGDLVLTVLSTEHRHFHRSGANLHAMLPIPLSTALLGGVVTVPTLHGPGTLRVPPCARNGQVLSLARFGVSKRLRDAVAVDLTHPNSLDSSSSTLPAGEEEEKGDMFFHVLVIIPKGEALTGRQRGLLDVFSDETEGRTETTDTTTTMTNEEAEQEPVDEKERQQQRFQACARMKDQYKHWLSS